MQLHINEMLHRRDAPSRPACDSETAAGSLSRSGAARKRALHGLDQWHIRPLLYSPILGRNHPHVTRVPAHQVDLQNRLEIDAAP